ncbi:MAG: hypothetical protein ACQERF_04880 [Actinomycetota bacterium]
MRLLVCGKGGSGKSTFLALMATVLGARGYDVVVLDGDASNPEGLVRLLFGLGVEDEPTPVVEYFGGVDRVTCPVDDPSPLTRVGETVAVPDRPLDLERELAPDYHLDTGNLHLYVVGKIEEYGQGCDGPLEKVVRDFVVAGPSVTLIDEKAGVEHFGRRIPDRVDLILGVLDCTRESVSIARRMMDFAADTGKDNVWFILNKVESPEMSDQMRELLGSLADRVIAEVPHVMELAEAALSGVPVGEELAATHASAVVERVETLAAGKVTASTSR